MLKEKIASQIQEVLAELGMPEIIPSVEYPADMSHGDYATNAAFVGAKQLKKNPLEVAEAIKEALSKKQLQFIEKIEVAKPGFLNITISKDYLISNTYRLLESGEKIATRIKTAKSADGEKKVVVEYSSPNIAKPFTVGHLRSTIIGDAVANLLEATGWTVYRDNHVGDWGTQFGKLIYAVKQWGNEEEIGRSQRPVKELVDLYVKFHQEAEKNPQIEDEAREWFKRLEEGDEEAKNLWKKCVTWSLREFDQIYKELGVTFTENEGKGYGESFFEDKMAPVIRELEEKGLLTESEGAKLVFFPEDKLPPLMIIKKDGTTLYATRDLATDKFRLEKYGKDVMVINEVGAEQALYFQQLFAVEEMLGWYQKGQRVHVRHGLYRFKDEKMSTRKGNVIWLEDVLQEAKTRALVLGHQSSESGQALGKPVMLPEDQERIARAVGIGAIKWNDLKRSSEQDIVFDWNDILNMQGNSGPYMQYTYARTQSVLRKAEDNEHKAINVAGYQLQKEELQILRLLSRFEEAVAEAAEKYAPNVLTTYLFDLAQAYNLFYQKLPILKEQETVRDFRLGITAATGNVIKQGLHMLGIKTPEKM